MTLSHLELAELREQLHGAGRALRISEPTDGPHEDRLGGGGPMMEFDPDSDVQDHFRALREARAAR